jgi:hypothetical protein
MSLNISDVKLMHYPFAESRTVAALAEATRRHNAASTIFIFTFCQQAGVLLFAVIVVDRTARKTIDDYNTPTSHFDIF